MKSKPNLDLLRSIAVVLVVLEHTLLAMRLHWIGRWDVAWLGVVGVFMFFVHTSLVLMWSLDRKPHVLDFYIRRVFRIYPLAIVAILITVIFRIPTLQSVDGATFFQTHGIKNVVSNLLLVQNLGWSGNILGVMWSLPLEVDMYVLLPFLYFFIRPNFVIWPLLLVWVGTVAYTRSALPDSSTFAVCIPYFLSGVIAYVLYSKTRAYLPGFLMPIWILALLLGFMTRPSWRNGWWLTLALGVTLPLFHSIRSKWVIRGSHEIARYSYGIYLVHPFCILIGINLLAGHNLALRIAGILLPMAALVIPAYHFLEKPMIDLGSRIAARLEERYEQTAPIC
jgi:peptidoglycan/LPS O-acetylase OafA/YrhL